MPDLGLNTLIYPLILPIITNVSQTSPYVNILFSFAQALVRAFEPRIMAVGLLTPIHASRIGALPNHRACLRVPRLFIPRAT